VAHGSATTNADRCPSFRIERADSEIGVGFAGIPLDEEFPSLTRAILEVGGHPPAVIAQDADKVRAIQGEHHFDVFFATYCPYCPEVVQAVNTMSVPNPNVTVTSIDGAMFPDEADERSVEGVPMVFRNGEPFAGGRMTLKGILAKLHT